jgi:hypothetical protein
MSHYIKDGLFIGSLPGYSILIQTEAELADIPEELPPGTIAYTAGFKKMWQKSVDGDWESLL